MFAKEGYRVALIARGPEKLKKVADDIAATHNAEIAAFPVENYSYKAFTDVFDAIRSYQWPSSGQSELRVAVYNAGAGVWKPFLEVTEADLQATIDGNINAAFAFARQVIQDFKKNSLDAKGKRGTLIFTGATASIRGNVTTSAFAAGKFALRALSQCLNKEFGKENIHVRALALCFLRGSARTDACMSVVNRSRTYVYLACAYLSRVVKADLGPAPDQSIIDGGECVERQPLDVIEC